MLTTEYADHVYAITRGGDSLYVIYTRMGDRPERILYAGESGIGLATLSGL